VCQKIKRNFSKRLAEMLILTPVKPNQIITTDIGGPLKETERGNKYFIVIIDHFTKYIKIYPMKRIQAEDVAEIIVNNWIMTFGIPESILTDGGTNYRSSLMEAVYEYMDIKCLRTTPFHPQCNGLSEKTVQTTKAMIRACVDDNQTNWDQLLEKLSFAYNTSVQLTTRLTPFELQFGRKPNIPIDIVLPNTELHTREKIIKEIIEKDETLGDIVVLEDLDENYWENKMPEVARNYLKKLKTTMEHSFNIARGNRNTRMELTQINHNRKIIKAKYEEGDLVLCDYPKIKKGLSRGISHKDYGPFVIQKIEKNQVDYVIKRLGIKNGKRYKIHQNRLKFYHATQQKRDSLEKGEEDDESSNDEQPAKSKRKYIKNMNNPRWKNNQNQNVTRETASETESESDFDENECITS
jgi:hypothetical protein